jgi:hypothetical protein
VKCQLSPWRWVRTCQTTPYDVFFAMIGEFKGRTGVRQHIVAVATITKIENRMRWGLEKLVSLCTKEVSMPWPTFCYSDGSIDALSKYDNILNWFLSPIQQQDILEKIMCRQTTVYFKVFGRQLKGELQLLTWTVTYRTPWTGGRLRQQRADALASTW